MEWQEGYELIEKSLEVELDNKIWDRWLVDYSKMTEDNFISFENYKALLTGKIDRTISTEDILKESEEILKLTEKKRGEIIGDRDI